jgi:hypothetical protein
LQPELGLLGRRFGQRFHFRDGFVQPLETRQRLRSQTVRHRQPRVVLQHRLDVDQRFVKLLAGHVGLGPVNER